MQKVLRINLNARHTALKKTRKKLLFNTRKAEKEYEQWQLRADAKQKEYVKDERLHRREDWIKGPLAPDRNTGLKKGRLGAMDSIMMQR
jgi:large subunit ribosomal protein L24